MKKKQTLVKFYKYRSNFFFTQLRCSRSCGISSGTKMRVAAHLWKHVLFFLFPPCCKRGARHASRRRELSTGGTSDGFFDLITPLQVGAGRSLAKGRYLAAYRARCGACSFATANYEEEERGVKKKGKGQKGEREGQLDKNRRESNKEWGINKGKKKMLECILLLAREMERNWSLEREMVE